MRPCPIAQRRAAVAGSSAAGCIQPQLALRRARGAPLVCRTAAPAAWAEPAAQPSRDPARLAEGAYDYEDAEAGTSAPPISPFVREREPTRSPPSIKETGTLRPSAEWYPAWMQYRRREDNYVFWQDKFLRCSLEVPWHEKRWTVFSTVWYLYMQLKYIGIPPALRYVFHLGWRALMFKLYDAHKAIVLWQCKLDAYLARQGAEGEDVGFSRAMALRRLHWRNSPLGEALYLVNIAKTGRVHFLPPVAKPIPRPTFFWLF